MFDSIYFIIEFLQEKKSKGNKLIRLATGEGVRKLRVPESKHNQWKRLMNLVQE